MGIVKRFMEISNKVQALKGEYLQTSSGLEQHDYQTFCRTYDCKDGLEHRLGDFEHIFTLDLRQ